MNIADQEPIIAGILSNYIASNAKFEQYYQLFKELIKSQEKTLSDLIFTSYLGDSNDEFQKILKSKNAHTKCLINVQEPKLLQIDEYISDTSSTQVYGPRTGSRLFSSKIMLASKYHIKRDASKIIEDIEQSNRLAIRGTGGPYQERHRAVDTRGSISGWLKNPQKINYHLEDEEPIASSLLRAKTGKTPEHFQFYNNISTRYITYGPQIQISQDSADIRVILWGRSALSDPRDLLKNRFNRQILARAGIEEPGSIAKTCEELIKYLLHTLSSDASRREKGILQSNSDFADTFSPNLELYRCVTKQQSESSIRRSNRYPQECDGYWESVKDVYQSHKQ